jgi:UDPglucose 6-dehydrogenase
MNVTIIGTGYVGLTTGVALGFLGHKVTCVDKNPAIVEKLQKGKVTIHEPGLEELLRLAMPNLSFRTTIPQLKGRGVVLIAVGTPTKANGDADLQYVDAAAKEVAACIQEGAELVVVNKSTVPIGSAQHVQGIIQRSLGANGVKANVWVASNPEFLAEGRATHDTLYPDRIVIGADSSAAIGILRELYAPLLEQTFDPPSETPRPERYTLPPLITTSTTSAELTKYAANSFLATKISFINEFAGLAEKVGADITQVARAIGLDSRIGAKFLHAGIGWGGSCFGKDTKAIMATASGYDYEMPIVKAATEVNKRQRLHVVDAPALTLIEHLHERGAVIRVHDPIAMESAKKLYPDLPVEYCEDALCLAMGCDAIVVVTDWQEYKQLPLAEMKKRMRGNVFLDARNLLNAADVERQGLKYVGIGR